MTDDTAYYQAACAALPTHLANDVRALCSSKSSENTLDSLIRFVVGADSPSDTSPETRSDWAQQQIAVKRALAALQPPTNTDVKRARDDETEHEHKELSSDQHTAKRPRKTNGVADEDDGGGAMLWSWQCLSATSPVRKKIDFGIHERSVRLTNASTQALEASVSLTSICRAFIVPGRGKSKPYWTVMLLTADIPDSAKSGDSTTPAVLPVVLNVDAVATTLMKCGTGNAPQTLSKGMKTIEYLRQMLSHLPDYVMPILEPSTDVFRSACLSGGSGINGAAGTGVPGVEAYRGAKGSTLWFLREGILWDGKACEFWAVEDLLNSEKGLRLVSATGRSCSVILLRKGSEHSDGKSEGDDEDEGTESEFGMIDGREQEGIKQWVRQHRHLFGKATTVSTTTPHKNNAPENQNAGTAPPINDSDDDDDDFTVNSGESDGGSATSDSSDDENEEASEADAEGSEVSEDDEGSPEELNEKHHPLLRPGAMPRMSRAAIDAVVEMMEDAVRGSSNFVEDSEDELME